MEEHKLLIETIKKNCEEENRKSSSVIFSWFGCILVTKNKAELKNTINKIHRLNPHYPLSFEKKNIKRYQYPFAQQMGVKKEQNTIDFRAHNLVGTPEEIIERINQYYDIGVNHIILSFLDYPSTTGIELFADIVIPHFK